MEPQSKILYIDDEEDNLVVFRSTFRGLFQVLTATSGMAGLTLLDEHPDVKLVITDQRMPQMSGVQFLEKLIPRHPAPTRIVLTGYTDINDIVNAINHGKIYHYVSKPWSKDSLKLVIDKGIEHFHLRKRNEELVYTLQEKNEKLLAAIDELELFLYRSSHDLRGPIASISGLINLVKLQPDSPENGSHINRIENQIAKLERTIQKLGKKSMQPTSASLTPKTWWSTMWWLK
ncbi:MAG: response regulator [Bacteroidia bacterium]|nr:response regulator [Bacteroidia bacterium]